VRHNAVATKATNSCSSSYGVLRQPARVPPKL